jgi:hypothetical protein
VTRATVRLDFLSLSLYPSYPFIPPIRLSLLPLYLLLINGNPLEDISVLTKPAENLALTLKDCKIHKNTIQ